MRCSIYHGKPRNAHVTLLLCASGIAHASHPKNIMTDSTAHLQAFRFDPALAHDVAHLQNLVALLGQWRWGEDSAADAIVQRKAATFVEPIATSELAALRPLAHQTLLYCGDRGISALRKILKTSHTSASDVLSTLVTLWEDTTHTRVLNEAMSGLFKPMQTLVKRADSETRAQCFVLWEHWLNTGVAIDSAVREAMLESVDPWLGDANDPAWPPASRVIERLSERAFAQRGVAIQ